MVVLVVGTWKTPDFDDAGILVAVVTIFLIACNGEKVAFGVPRYLKCR